MGTERITRRTILSSAAGLAGMALPGTAFGQAAGARRVIIDTDPGVDDAFALLLAMRSPELKIEGITPVAGNVPLELSLPNALRMVEIAGRTDIPVAAGAKTPLQRRLITATYAHGENGLGGAVFPAPKIKPIADPASVFIRQVVRKYPGQVSLIMLGPQTNLATALASDPDLARMIKSVVMMGGSLSGGNVTPAAEFNIYVDPEAARMVFQSGIPITMVGLDVTRKTALTDAHVKVLEAANTPVSMAAAKIARNVSQAALADAQALFTTIDKLASAKSISEAVQINTDALKAQGEVLVGRAKATTEYLGKVIADGAKSAQDNFAKVANFSKTA